MQCKVILGFNKLLHTVLCDQVVHKDHSMS